MDVTELNVTFTVERKEPPEQTGGRGVWKLRLSPLLEDPGTWYKVAEGPTVKIERMKYSLAEGRYKAPDGVWEYDLHRKGATAELYARYVGPDTE
jgi:hypothetical protein